MHNFLLPTALVRMITPSLSGSLREIGPTLWMRVWKRLGLAQGLALVILVRSLSSGADSRRQQTTFASAESTPALASGLALVLVLVLVLALDLIIGALWS